MVWPRPVVHQPAFSLLRPQIEADLLPLCRREQIAVVPYRVLEGGLLTGKYRPGQAPPEGSRAAEKPDWVPLMQDEAALSRLAELEEAARAGGLALFDYVLRHSLAVPGITSVILGVKRVAQLEAASMAVGGLGA